MRRKLFQSTLPLRGATNCTTNTRHGHAISIHAPLAGSDANVLPGPRAPMIFQSTLPLRGATTIQPPAGMRTPNFNPRSPCGERRSRRITRNPRRDFNPRSPCGERLFPGILVSHQWNFNPRSPCGERRVMRWTGLKSETFQSTLPLRGAT